MPQANTPDLASLHSELEPSFLVTSLTRSQSNQSASLPAILAALVPSLISAVFLLTVFALIKRPLRRIYSPRTYIDVIPEK